MPGSFLLFRLRREGILFLPGLPEGDVDGGTDIDHKAAAIEPEHYENERCERAVKQRIFDGGVDEEGEQGAYAHHEEGCR